MRTISLGVVLSLFWLLLSGHYDTFLLVMGGLSVVLCVWLARRMAVLDAEGHPVHLVPGAVTYFPWLLWEIAKSAVAVTRVVLSPGARVSPRLVRIDAGQKTQVGINVFANSITLTPGTISVDVEDGVLIVHALTAEGAEELAGGAMNRRVQRMEGET